MTAALSLRELTKSFGGGGDERPALSPLTLEIAAAQRVALVGHNGSGKTTMLRMVAAVGNRVEALHRSVFGALELPADLLPGQWRWLSGPGDVGGA